MQTLNYGERAEFKTGTDKTFISRGGLKQELFLLAFANGPLGPGSLLQPFLSSPTVLVPLLALTLPLAGRFTLKYLPVSCGQRVFSIMYTLLTLPSC